MAGWLHVGPAHCASSFAADEQAANLAEVERAQHLDSKDFVRPRLRLRLDGIR